MSLQHDAATDNVATSAQQSTTDVEKFHVAIPNQQERPKTGAVDGDNGAQSAIFQTTTSTGAFSSAPNASSKDSKRADSKSRNLPSMCGHRAQQYKLLRSFGQSDRSEVYEAAVLTQQGGEDTGARVAIKVVELDTTPAMLPMRQREAVVASLMRHGSVATPVCTFQNDSKLWSVMQLMDRGSLHDILQSSGFSSGMDEKCLAAVLFQLVDALVYVHKAGHIHRNVKAAKVLVNSDGTVKLCDFTMSAPVIDSGRRVTKRQTYIGSPFWCAPEVLEQEHGYDAKADVWSFGILAFQLATGQHPYEHMTPLKALKTILKGRPPALDSEQWSMATSKEFRSMVQACLTQSPSARPSSSVLKSMPFFKKLDEKSLLKKKQHFASKLKEIPDSRAELLVPVESGGTGNSTPTAEISQFSSIQMSASSPGLQPRGGSGGGGRPQSMEWTWNFDVESLSSLSEEQLAQASPSTLPAYRVEATDVTAASTPHKDGPSWLKEPALQVEDGTPSPLLENQQAASTPEWDLDGVPDIPESAPASDLLAIPLSGQDRRCSPLPSFDSAAPQTASNCQSQASEELAGSANSSKVPIRSTMQGNDKMSGETSESIVSSVPPAVEIEGCEKVQPGPDSDLRVGTTGPIMQEKQELPTSPGTPGSVQRKNRVPTFGDDKEKDASRGPRVIKLEDVVTSPPRPSQSSEVDDGSAAAVAKQATQHAANSVESVSVLPTSDSLNSRSATMMQGFESGQVAANVNAETPFKRYTDPSGPSGASTQSPSKTQIDTSAQGHGSLVPPAASHVTSLNTSHLDSLGQSSSSHNPTGNGATSSISEEQVPKKKRTFVVSSSSPSNTSKKASSSSISTANVTAPPMPVSSGAAGAQFQPAVESFISQQRETIDTLIDENRLLKKEVQQLKELLARHGVSVAPPKS